MASSKAIFGTAVLGSLLLAGFDLNFSVAPVSGVETEKISANNLARLILTSRPLTKRAKTEVAVESEPEENIDENVEFRNCGTADILIGDKEMSTTELVTESKNSGAEYIDQNTKGRRQLSQTEETHSKLDKATDVQEDHNEATAATSKEENNEQEVEEGVSSEVAAEELAKDAYVIEDAAESIKEDVSDVREAATERADGDTSELAGDTSGTRRLSEESIPETADDSYKPETKEDDLIPKAEADEVEEVTGRKLRGEDKTVNLNDTEATSNGVTFVMEEVIKESKETLDTMVSTVGKFTVESEEIFDEAIPVE